MAVSIVIPRVDANFMQSSVNSFEFRVCILIGSRNPLAENLTLVFHDWRWNFFSPPPRSVSFIGNNNKVFNRIGNIMGGRGRVDDNCLSFTFPSIYYYSISLSVGKN